MAEGLNKGWIKVYRQLQDCYLWYDKPFNQGAAWVDILLNANHKDTKIIFDHKPMEVKAGCFVTSSVKLAERWGWSRGKVTRFLKILEDEQMIELDVDSKRTAITIVNYCKFQDTQTGDSTSDGHLTDNRRTSDGHLADTNKNEKNIKNEKNVKNEKKIYYPTDELLNQAFTEYVEMRKKLRKPFATDHAIELAMKKLENLSGGDNDKAIKILEQSLVNSWQGLFELKEPKNTTKGIDWDNL